VKVALFHPEVLKMLRGCNTEVKKKFGDLIYDLQAGKLIGPPDSKTFHAIKKGVFELRVKDQRNGYRVFYFTKVADKILIFHMFQKKADKTPLKEINTGKIRLNEMLEVLNEK